MRGLSSCTRSHPKPSRSSTPGPKFSTSTSARLINSPRMRLPRSALMLRVMLRLLQLSIVKYRLSTPGKSRSCVRVMSPRPGISTLITSAPSQARIWVQLGPDCTWVMSRTRTPVNAFSIARLASLRAPSLVHRLVHRARRVNFGIDPHVDERALAGLARPAQRRRDILRLAHLLAVSAEHFGELVEMHVAQAIGDLAALLAVFDRLPIADLIHVRVVADHADERQVVAHAGLEVPSSQRKGAVAEQADHFLLRPRQLRRHRERRADAERAERSGIHPVARRLGLDHAARKGHHVATVADE